MDVSPEYIKMCEKAKEIQALRVLANGDYEVRLKYGKGQVEVHHHREITAHYRPENHLWLPRQDQLQEMVGGFNQPRIDWLEWLKHIYNHWSYGNPFDNANRFTSFEQEWLAFVMYECYREIWNGKDWVSGSS